MESLPPEINILIFSYLLPDKSCDINSFRNYFLVCKKFYNLLHTIDLKIIFSKSLNLYYNLTRFCNDNQYRTNIINDYNNLILYSYHKYIINKYEDELIETIGLNNLLNLPVCKFNKSKCIDNKCYLNDTKCYYNNHNLKNFITNPIMRGIDDLGNTYIVFLYKNIDNNKYNYEFIYNKIVNNTNIVTYSGIYNNTYIGMLSDNKILNIDIPLNEYIYNRELTQYSYDYIKRLINNDICSIPRYNSATDSYYEVVNFRRKGHITLYY